jgi:hypothetical protein
MAAFIVLGFAAFVGMTATTPPEGAQEPASPIIHVGDTETQEGASGAGREGVTVVATMYSCEPHANNRMFPCNVTRWGYSPTAPGMACPVEWRERVFDVPDHGRLRCDDTGRHDNLNGLPHVDIRGGYAEAIQWGVQTIVIYARP